MSIVFAEQIRANYKCTTMRKFTSHDNAGLRIGLHCVLLVVLLLLLNDASLIAQRNLTLYNLPGIPQSQTMNVGRMPDYNFHLSLPLISNINLGANSSGFSANEIRNLDSGNNGEGTNSSFFETDFSNFIKQIGPYNTLGFNFNTTLLDAGIRLGRGYIGIQGTENVNTLLGYSESLFQTFSELQGLELKDFENGPRKYSVYGTYLDFSHYRTLGASYTYNIIPGKLSAGLRAKMAIGLGRAWTRSSDFDIVGDLQQGILGLEGNVGLLMAGLPAAFDSTQGLSTYLKGSGNKGLAVDLGAQYKVNDKIDVYASIVNLGQIVWRNNLTEYGYTTKYLDFYANQPDQASEALDKVIDFVTTPEKTKYLGRVVSPLPLYVYVGGNYHINKHFSAGAMVNLEHLDGHNYVNFAVNGSANIGRILQAGLTVAQVKGIGTQVGAGASVNLGPIQIYAVSDNVASAFNIGNARNAQVNVGLNLIFGRGKHNADVAMADSSGVEPSAIASADSLAEANKMKKTKPKKEKESVAETKVRPEPSTNKPSAPAPAVTNTVLKPWVNLRGTSFNATSREQLTGVTVELYQKQGDREVLAYVRGNPGMDFLAPMERNKEYRVVVKKNGFKPTEGAVSLDELAGANELKKEFFLETAPVEEPTPISKPTPKPTTTDSTATNKPNATANPGTQIPGNIKALGIFTVLVASDLKPTASADGVTVIKIGAGFRVQVLEKTNENWWLISFRGNNGYVSAKALREEK